MARLMFVVPAVIGGIVGIVLATSHENMSIVPVLALVILAAAAVALPLLLRELTHVGGGSDMPPYVRVRDELNSRGFRGPSLVHTRDLLALAGNAYDLHFRLRPILIGVVGDLLSLRNRIDFHEHPDQAQTHLGQQLWELVRPERPVPEGRFSDPGLSPVQLDRLISDLEALAA